MNPGRDVVSQSMDLVHRPTRDRLVERAGAATRVRHFGWRQRLIGTVFAPLTWRERLRDSEACLNAQPETLQQRGFRAPLARSTRAEANEPRAGRLGRDLPRGLLAQARRLSAGEKLGWEFDHPR